MQNIEGDGVKDVAKFMRKEMVAAGVMEPTQEEAQALAQAAQNQQPDPNVLYVQAAAEKERAQAQKAQADSVNALADADLKRAKVQETLSKMSLDDRRIVLDTMMAMNQMGAQRGNATQ
jgi:hypothetical protein